MSNNVLYDFKKIEKKWREKWEESGIYKTPKDVTSKNKYYILPQLPYPSGSGLHAGHAETYTACDIVARFKRMKGEKVLQVIGWDAFGLPAENFAIKTNVHPRINTDKAIDNFRDQIKRLGISVDWDREVGSHNLDYYKWTQWFFLLMYNQGLAYRKNQKVNWCPSCKTVLANEQVLTTKLDAGQEVEVCERCDTEVEHKMMEQWYLKITEYADRLAKDLDKVDWPKESVKRQRDWIGRSEGATIKFQIADDCHSGLDPESTGISERDIEVFTTAHDTIFGVTFLVLSPEHPLVSQITTNERKQDVEDYVKKASKKSEIERTDMTKEKNGVFTGAYVINPFNGQKVPVWVADYVLMHYGTGAVMGVPGHDERDNEFAKKYGLEIPYVVKDLDEFISYTGEIKQKSEKYIIANSGQYDGMTFKVGKQKMLEDMIEKGFGEAKVTYKLRDWSVSRQRFWGAPIPFLHSRNGNSKHETRNSKLQDKPDFVLTAHAYESSPEKAYHPWIDDQLEKMGIEPSTPELPSHTYAKFDEWIGVLDSSVRSRIESGMTTEGMVVTGRSLGSWAILKLAEKYKFRKLILVCPANPTQWEGKGHNMLLDAFQDSKESLDILKKFVIEDGGIDFEKVRQNTAEVVVYLGINDPYVYYKSTEEFFRKHLPEVRVKRFRNGRHFNEKNGFTEFPKLLEEITKEVRADLKPIPESDLPVILPDDVDFKPTGQSPLTYSKAFAQGVEAKYGKEWVREPDTLDTFMCSSWYYFRYIDPHNDEAFASEESIKKWMPVDFYLGGPEHVNGHLLYSRFFTKVLYDAGYIDFDEPFMVHRHQGLILGEDNRKMSKRWGNIINPSEAADAYGADTFRMYEMFMGPLEEAKPWSSKGVMGVKRFLEKVWRLGISRERFASDKSVQLGGDRPSVVRKQRSEINKLIQKVENDIEKLSFNTAIAKCMEFVNFLNREKEIDVEVWKKFLLVLAPFTPFISEELWSLSGFALPAGRQDRNDKYGKSIHLENWPQVDKSAIEEEGIVIGVQINGKVRDDIKLAKDASQGEAVELAQKSEKVQIHLEGKQVVKVIYVPGKILNFVVK